jgi:hypothetical protein
VKREAVGETEVVAAATAVAAAQGEAAGEAVAVVASPAVAGVVLNSGGTRVTLKMMYLAICDRTTPQPRSTPMLWSGKQLTTLKMSTT